MTRNMTRKQFFTRSTAIAFLLATLLPATIGNANACPEITMDPVNGSPSTQSDLQAALDALTGPVIIADASD